jgi:hypothetical protein
MAVKKAQTKKVRDSEKKKDDDVFYPNTMKHKVQFAADAKPPRPVNISNKTASFADSMNVDLNP